MSIRTARPGWVLGLFAVLACILVAAGLAPDVVGASPLSLSIDWFDGFTGHIDGLAAVGAAIASGPLASTKQKPKGENVDRSDEDDEDAGDPVDESDSGVTRTELNQMIADATRGVVAEELRSVLETNRTETRTALAEVLRPTPRDLARVVGPRTPHYRQRFLALMGLQAARGAEDQNASAVLERKLKDLNGEITDEMRYDEYMIARNHIETTLGWKGERLERTMSTLTDGAGAYAVPLPIAAEIFVVIEEVGVARRNSRAVQVVHKSLALNSVGTKITAYWTAENATYTASDPALERALLTPYKLTALTSWSHELDEDEAQALLPLRIELIGEAMAEKEDIAFFNGDGTTTYGSITGLLNLSSAVAVVQGAGDTAHTDITMAKLRAMKYAVSLKRRRGAKYYMNPAILDIIEGLEYDQAASNLPGITRNSAGEITRIWGHEYELSEDMPATAGADTPYVVFGNAMRYTLRGEKAGMSIETTRVGVIHNSGNGQVTYNALTQDGTILAARQRVTYGVPDAFEESFAVLKTAAA